MLFKVIYRLTSGKTQTHILTGPDDATIDDCERVIELVAASYGIDTDYLHIRIVSENPSKGFLHPLQNVLPDGRVATVTGWYF